MLEDEVPGVKEQKDVPVYLTDEEREDHVNLLLLTDGENHHFTQIKRMSALIGRQLSKNRSQKHICNRCLRYWKELEKFYLHGIDCKKMNNCRIKLPDENNNKLKFKKD